MTKANDIQIGGDHYKNMAVEPWDVIDTWPIEQRIGAYRAGMLKYTMRMGSKDEHVQEIGKGVHYGQKLQEVLEQAADIDKHESRTLLFSEAELAAMYDKSASGMEFGKTLQTALLKRLLGNTNVHD